MSDKKTETVYCLKYALTTGIIEIVGHEIENGLFMRTDVPCVQCLGKTEWVRDAEEALALAEALRVKKLESLERQTKKLKSMVISVP